MFGMSLAEILVVVVLLLVVVGPERLPEVARVIGKGLREIRRATNMFRDTIQVDDTIDANTFDRPVDQQVERDDGYTTEYNHDGLAEENPHAGGGYGRDIEMHTETVEAADSGPEVTRVDLAAAESTEAIRWIYVPHPHRNILY